MFINSIQITFFSGTGGVKRIVTAFEQECFRRGIPFSHNDLDRSINNRRSGSPARALLPDDLVLLVFPLHAFDAPLPVYDWLKETNLEGHEVAVISVSGGGEAWPNTGCRYRLCREIEAKGGRVVYERMLVMPSNWMFTPNDHLAMHLLQAVPHKVNQVLAEVLAGWVRRSDEQLSRERAFLARLEKEHTFEFPRSITVNVNCTGCGICKNHCPVENIQIREHRPLFGENCIMCFRCIYICPFNAMKSNNLMVLKKGYNLNELEKRMQGVELLPVEKCASGWLWSALRDYLLDGE
ncbi:MAG: EFR1 family ferrodoxin [Anaerolineae bacterium]|nr:EFR1 family ferrodoxin [Anaerolineae bacterium]